MRCQGIGSSPFPARTGGQPAQSAVGKPPIQSDSLEEGLRPSPEVWSPRSSSSSVPSHQLVSHDFLVINPHKITSRIINPHKITSGGAEAGSHPPFSSWPLTSPTGHASPARRTAPTGAVLSPRLLGAEHGADHNHHNRCCSESSQAAPCPSSALSPGAGEEEDAIGDSAVLHCSCHCFLHRIHPVLSAQGEGHGQTW